MDAHVTVTLLKSVVLSDVMQVIPANDDGTLHLHLLHDTGKDASSDGHVAGKRALLVDVGSLDGLNIESRANS